MYMHYQAPNNAAPSIPITQTQSKSYSKREKRPLDIMDPTTGQKIDINAGNNEGGAARSTPPSAQGDDSPRNTPPQAVSSWLTLHI